MAHHMTCRGRVASHGRCRASTRPPSRLLVDRPLWRAWSWPSLRPSVDTALRQASEVVVSTIQRRHTPLRWARRWPSAKSVRFSVDITAAGRWGGRLHDPAMDLDANVQAFVHECTCAAYQDWIRANSG